MAIAGAGTDLAAYVFGHFVRITGRSILLLLCKKSVEAAGCSGSVQGGGAACQEDGIRNEY